MRARLVCIALLCAAVFAAPAPAREAASASAGDRAARPDVTLHATSSGIGPFHRGGTPMPLAVRMSGTRLRIDFTSPGEGHGYLLAHGGGRQAWLVSQAGQLALPVPAPVWAQFRVDPQAPCAGMGARCEPGAVDVVARRVVRQWRYRGADGRGPDGTDSGTLWVEPGTGLLLRFRGRVAGQRREHEFTVLSVTDDALDPAVFELPRTLDELDAGRAATRPPPAGVSR